MITSQQLLKITPNIKKEKVDSIVDAINKTFSKYDINTKLRQAAWIAQCAHESGGFTVFVENLNYSAEGLNKVFKKYFPTLESAQPYARQPEKIANKVYADRMGNGNEKSGDGWKYRGKGAIQLTGKNNHVSFAKSFDMSIDEAVAYLSTIEGAIISAGWFWNNLQLNMYADVKDMKTITKKINGGLNGYDDRMKYYNLALSVI